MERKNNTLIVTLLSVIIGILALSCALLIFGIARHNKDKSSKPSFGSQPSSSHQSSINSTPSQNNSSEPDNTSSEPDNTSSETNSNDSSEQGTTSSEPEEPVTLQNVMQKLNGVWGYRSYMIYVNSDKNEYLEAMYATSGGFTGKIMKVKETAVNTFELEVFVKGHPADEVQEETQDETKFIVFEIDPAKNVIKTNGNEYQFITDDYSDDETISNFFFGDLEEE